MPLLGGPLHRAVLRGPLPLVAAFARDARRGLLRAFGCSASAACCRGACGGFARLPLGAWTELTPGRDRLRYKTRAEKACVASVSIVRRSLRARCVCPPAGFCWYDADAFASCLVMYFWSYF